jgi:hypothetical protein
MFQMFLSFSPIFIEKYLNTQLDISLWLSFETFKKYYGENIQSSHRHKSNPTTTTWQNLKISQANKMALHTKSYKNEH